MWNYVLRLFFGCVIYHYNVQFSLKKKNKKPSVERRAKFAVFLSQEVGENPVSRIEQLDI